jgi:IS5 family transposase
LFQSCTTGLPSEYGQIEETMSATAWNLKKMMEKLKAEFLQLIFRLFAPQNFYLATA